MSEWFVNSNQTKHEMDKTHSNFISGIMDGDVYFIIACFKSEVAEI